MINLMYMTKVGIGGWATFTRHLHDVLVAHGQEVQIWKIGNRTEHFQRPFGPSHTYRNISEADAQTLNTTGLTIIACLGKHYVELAAAMQRGCGARMVVHDTAESTNRMALERPWVIRRALVPLFPGAVFMRHPYVRHEPIKCAKRSGALATSRVDFDKNTAMILDAIRLGAPIEIIGFENRLYTKFKIVPKYPEWQQSTGLHPRTGAGSYAALCGAQFMVDLTDIKGDGGGTQYTFLEAWDAGAIPIIGSWWMRPKDDMQPGINCLFASDAENLVSIFKRKYSTGLLADMRANGEHQLRKHSAKVLGPQIMEWLK